MSAVPLDWLIGARHFKDDVAQLRRLLGAFDDFTMRSLNSRNSRAATQAAAATTAEAHVDDEAAQLLSHVDESAMANTVAFASRAVSALGVLALVCRNIVEHPTEQKYRRVRLSSATFRKVLEAAVPLGAPDATAGLPAVVGFFTDVLGFELLDADGAHCSASAPEFLALPPAAPLRTVHDTVDAAVLAQQEEEAVVAVVQEVREAAAALRARVAQSAEDRAIAEQHAAAADGGGAGRRGAVASFCEAVQRVAESAAGIDFDAAGKKVDDALAAVAAAADAPAAVRDAPMWSTPAAGAVAEATTQLLAPALVAINETWPSLGATAAASANGVAVTASNPSGAPPDAARFTSTVRALRDALSEARIAADNKRHRDERAFRARKPTAPQASSSSTTAGARANMTQEQAAALRERDIVASTTIGDIAALMALHWELAGAVGYVAEHRVEAKRLHAAYSAGDVDIARLHALRDEWQGKVDAKRLEVAAGKERDRRV